MFDIGESLRAERRRQKLDLSDVAAETRIRVNYLGALEQGQFDRLPPGLYQRSFLREYADFLGLDGDAFAQEYDLQFAPPNPEPVRPLPAATNWRSALTLIAGRRPLLGVATIIVLLLAGGAVWLFNRGGPGPVSRRPPTPAPAAIQAPTARRHHGRAPTPGKPQQQISLTLKATRGNCWLQVQLGNTSGQTLYEQTLQQGQTARFSLRRPLLIRLGAPWNIDATIAGRSVTATLPQHTATILASANGLTPAH